MYDRQAGGDHIYERYRTTINGGERLCTSVMWIAESLPEIVPKIWELCNRN